MYLIIKNKLSIEKIIYHERGNGDKNDLFFFKKSKFLRKKNIIIFCVILFIIEILPIIILSVVVIIIKEPKRCKYNNAFKAYELIIFSMNYLIFIALTIAIS